MTTAIQIIEGAAEEVSVKTAESALEADDSQVILNRMNDLLMEWKDIGLTPQFQEVFNLDDTVAIDRSAVSAVKLTLAIRISPSFQAVVTQALALSADDAYTRLLASTAYIGPVAYPDTLPIGSGNECSDTITDRRFFNQNNVEHF